MTGVTAALLVLVVLVALADLLAPLPRAALSAIVIQAVWGLMDVSALRRYQSIRRNDITAAIAAMVGVLVLGPLYGLLVAIGLAVLGLVYRSSRVETDVMGKVPGEKAAWGSVTEHPERRTYDGILVLRLDVPLFWANASEIHDRVLGTVESYPGTQVVLLDLEATSQLDTTSIDMLELVLTRLREREIDLYLVRVFYRARLTLAKAGFIEHARRGSHVAQHLGGRPCRARGEPPDREVAHPGRPTAGPAGHRRGLRAVRRARRGAHRGRPRRQCPDARRYRRGGAARRIPGPREARKEVEEPLPSYLTC